MPLDSPPTGGCILVTTIGDAYAAIIKWIEANGYHHVGPGREVYLQSPAQLGNQTDPDTVTEIQFPVEKM